jgi:hypothetical protein
MKWYRQDDGKWEPQGGNDPTRHALRNCPPDLFGLLFDCTCGQWGPVKQGLTNDVRHEHLLHAIA